MERKGREKGINMLGKFLCGEDDVNLGIREHLIRRIAFFGIFISLVAFSEVFVAQNTYLTLIPLSVLIVLLIIALLLAYKYKKHDAAAILICIAAEFIAFPAVFFLSGGINGGSTIWFVLGIFYSIGMFHGIRMVIFTGLTFVADFLCYYIGYIHPEYIVKLDNNEIYLDSFLGVILVGILLGIVSKYQIKSYEREKIKALEQKDEIEKLSDSKSDFFANMSHEIRTPINAIIGLDEMILREKDISEEVYENATSIQNASKMLLSLVNDILDLSKIESQKMQILPFEYSTVEMFSELVDMIKLRVKEKNLDFIVNIDRDIPVTLYGDDKRLKQIILNLLTNAVKYTNEGTVTLEAHADKIGEEWCKLTVSVSDTGIGIKSENFEALFDSFSRINNSENRNIEGTGLGLAISKHLIELMGGQITVDSIYTKGSTFTIMLEQRIADNSPIGTNDILRKDNNSKNAYQQLFEAPEANILVVDDNEMNRMVIAKLLRATKVNVETASSGQECLMMAQQKYYHVILMDYLMPEMDGAITLRYLRKQENSLCRETPIIVLTGDTLLHQQSVFGEMGFDGYLEKPIRGDFLEETILKFLPEEVVEYRLNNNMISSVSSFGEKTYKRKQKKIVVTTECTCDLSDELLEKYDLSQIYLYINLKNGRFKDTKEIDIDNIAMYNSGNGEIKAQAAPVEDYEKFFAERLTYAEEVIHISLGKNMGKSYSNALKAAKGFGHVRVIDSGNMSCGMALVVLTAARQVMLGASVEEVCELVENVKTQIVSSFIMPSIDIFYKNGYTNRFIYSVCHAFRFHPIVKARKSTFVIASGKIGNNYICRKKFLKSYFKKYINLNHDIIYITYAGISVEEQERLLSEINNFKGFKQIIVQKCSATNACFSGRGTIGMAVYVEK